MATQYQLLDTIVRGSTAARRVRRFWSDDDERRIVAHSYAPDVSVLVVALRYDAKANLTFTCRRDPRYKPAGDAEDIDELLPWNCAPGEDWQADP